MNSWTQVSFTSPVGPLRCLRIEQVGLAADPLAVLLVRLIVLVAVDEHHHVGVLLDGARLAQVAELRLVASATTRPAG